MSDERKGAQDSAQRDGFLGQIIQWLQSLLDGRGEDSDSKRPDPRPRPKAQDHGERGGAYGKGAYGRGPYAGDDADSPGGRP